MEEKWTKGPWELGGCSGRMVRKPGYGDIADVDVLANAHLIAAAPDLYEAAWLTCLMFERKNVSTAEADWMGDDEHAAWTALEAALRKARGEA